MNRVTSRDGTSIVYEQVGSGPALILVGGGLDDGSENAPLARELAADFAVYNYARRGRGDSGDTVPYVLEREIDDIEALVAAAGGTAHLFGVSSGGALVLEAAAAGTAVDKLAVYEVPYNTADDWPQRWRHYVDKLEAVLTEGRRGDALELFMELAGSSEEDIESTDLALLACHGDPRAHARVRRGLPGKRPATHSPLGQDHAADLGGHWCRCAPAWSRSLGSRPRSGRGCHRRKHPARATSDLRRSVTRRRPEGARPDPRTVLQKLTSPRFGSTTEASPNTG
jgi:pimeloyl-ACP methyl ester carboxylesterase